MDRQRLAYRPDIDGLRAVAVLSVVFCHAKLSFSGGFVGVDVFFVISGFLITSLIQRDIENDAFSFGKFWERRIRRILPALLVVVISTMIAGWFLLMPDAYQSLAESVVGLSLLVSNVHFWQNTGYFAKSAEEMPLIHTWSLAVEEQFYLIVPLILVLLTKVTNTNWQRAALITAAILSLFMSIYGTNHHPSATFYLLPTRAWELLAGCILAMTRRVPSTRHLMKDEVLSIAGLTLILVPCFLYTETTIFPGLAALPPVLGSVLLIWAGTNTTHLSIVSKALSHRTFVFVGLISYSLYLWHWPLFAFLRYQQREPLSVKQAVVISVCSVCLGAASWRFIEMPFRNSNIIKSRARSVTFALTSFVVFIIAGMTIIGQGGFSGRVSQQAQLYVETARRDHQWTLEFTKNDVPHNLRKLGNSDIAPRLLVWGDSHAMAVLPAIDAICRERQICGIAATHSSTLPVKNYFQTDGNGLKERAVPFNDAVIDYVRTAQIDAVLMVACGWNGHLCDPNCLAATLETTRILRNYGAVVYLMDSVPCFSYDVAKFTSIYSQSGKLSELKMYLRDYNERQALNEDTLLTMKQHGIHVLKPATILFNEKNEFLPYDSSGAYYRDGGHLSNYGALKLKPLFEPIFESLHRTDDYSAPRLASGVDASQKS